MRETPPQTSWQALAKQWPRAYDRPLLSGVVKQDPEDFCVTEQWSFRPSGAGEHVWLRIRKRKANTAQVAKLLARHACVPYRDVSYSGLKDYFAVTEQWFSVRMPLQKEVDWSVLNTPNLSVLESVRHHKKLKRGSHASNRFHLMIRQLRGDRDEFLQRWQACCKAGIPNYFGEQRFGRDFGNMHKAAQLFTKAIRIKDKTTRGLILSAARSWLFNECLADRVSKQSWQQLDLGEPAVLQGSESFFIANQEEDLPARLEKLDIHPSCPLWGDVDTKLIANFPGRHAQEVNVVSRFSELADGLVAARLEYGRRATRCIMLESEMAFENENLAISFSLQKGQFATTVLRELLDGVE